MLVTVAYLDLELFQKNGNKDNDGSGLVFWGYAQPKHDSLSKRVKPVNLDTIH